MNGKPSTSRNFWVLPIRMRASEKNDLQGSVKRFQFEIDLMGSCVKNEKLGCLSISILKTIGSWLTCFRKCKSMQKKLKEQIFIKTIYVKNSQKLF